MSDHSKYLFLCAKAIYPVPVGADVHAKKSSLTVQELSVNHEIHAQLNKKSIRYNWHEADVTVLEGILARGDRKVGDAILKAYENGALFDAWSEYYHTGILEGGICRVRY